MSVSVMARSGPCVRPSFSSGPRRVQPARAPFGCGAPRLARPMLAPARAFYRSGSTWDEAAMKELMQDMAKMWKQAAAANTGGVFLWPGGGYVYGTGQRCKPYGPGAASDTSSSSGGSGKPTLPLDVVSTDGFYLLYADIPGLTKSELSIKLSKERQLTISGERKAPLEEGYSSKERAFGPFERSWALPDDADSEGISAKVAEGVLTITVPKKQPQPEVDDAQDIAIN